MAHKKLHFKFYLNNVNCKST